jgi:hypothetical protein
MAPLMKVRTNKLMSCKISAIVMSLSGKSIRQLSGVLKIFNILFCVVITKVYTYANINQMEHSNSLLFIVNINKTLNIKCAQSIKYY